MNAVHLAVQQHLAQQRGEGKAAKRGAPAKPQQAVPAGKAQWQNMQLVRMVACGGAHTAVLTVRWRAAAPGHVQTELGD